VWSGLVGVVVLLFSSAPHPASQQKSALFSLGARHSVDAPTRRPELELALVCSRGLVPCSSWPSRPSVLAPSSPTLTPTLSTSPARATDYAAAGVSKGAPHHFGAYNPKTRPLGPSSSFTSTLPRQVPGNSPGRACLYHSEPGATGETRPGR